MDIDQILTTEKILLGVKATSKSQLLRDLSHYLVPIIARDTGATESASERNIFEILIERERLGTTGVGNGIAIPHGKMPKLKQLVGIFARLEQPIDFEAIDDQPVDLIFLLMAPEGAGADHLKALAHISRILRNRSLCEILRSTNSPAEVLKIFASPVAGPGSAPPHA
ncbi:MAG: PTS sugar transporter subunit IIA [Alphaproteobacteria bacterium]|nr:PTS sugar transporter subunit IIA [Alphaproteobacteria bacterium]